MAPFCGLYLESYEVIPKRNYLEAMDIPVEEFRTARFGAVG